MVEEYQIDEIMDQRRDAEQAQQKEQVVGLGLLAADRKPIASNGLGHRVEPE